MDNNLLVRLANPDDYKKLSAFRIAQFKDNNEYILKDSLLLSKQNGFIYIIELINGIKKDIISTMQVEYIQSVIHFNNLYKQYYDIPLESSIFPSLYISKVATIKSLRNIGLNSYLRAQSLNFANTKEEIQSLTGVVFDGSPRVHLMQKIGYQSKEMKFEDSSYLKPLVQTYFMWLVRTKFSDALSLLKTEISYLEKSYNINNTVSNYSF